MGRLLNGQNPGQPLTERHQQLAAVQASLRRQAKQPGERNQPAEQQECEAGQQRNRFLGQIVSSMAQEDPSRAAALVSSLAPAGDQYGMVSQVAHAYANSDPKAAVEWLASLPEGPARRTALQSISYQLAREDPNAAIELYNKLPLGRERDNLAQTLTSSLANQDLPKAIAWVDSRVAMWVNRVGRVTYRDPLAASRPMSIGGTLPDALPKFAARPNGRRQSSDLTKVSLPTES